MIFSTTEDPYIEEGKVDKDRKPNGLDAVEASRQSKLLEGAVVFQEWKTKHQSNNTIPNVCRARSNWA